MCIITTRKVGRSISKKKQEATSLPRESDEVIRMSKKQNWEREKAKSTLNVNKAVSENLNEYQGDYRESKHNQRLVKNKHQCNHSTNARRDNGLEADVNVDKDSGESSQKFLQLDFSRLKANAEPEPETPERITMGNVKKSEEPSKSLWSSSNELE